MKKIGKSIKFLIYRTLIGVAFFICATFSISFFGNRLYIGFYLLSSFVISVLSFWIFGTAVWFGFGNTRFKILSSYLIAASGLFIAVYILWYATYLH
jgi:hypothetical protein